MGNFPTVTTLGATEFTHRANLHRAAFDAYRFSLAQRLSHFTPGRLDDPREGLAGNVHELRRIFLIQPAEIRQANRFQLIMGQDHFAGFRNILRAALGDEAVPRNQMGDFSAAAGSGHKQYTFQ